MRRNKIKNKYLDIIYNTDKEVTLKDINIFDKIENSIFNILKSFGLILLMVTWGAIPVIILMLLGIDYTKMANTPKIIISFITDMALILLLVKIYYKTLKNDFKNFFNKNILSHLKNAFIYWGIGLLVMYFSNIIISIINDGKLAENEEAVRSLIDVLPFYMAFQLMIYAPITEELIFRRSIRDIVKNKWIYAILSGLIFGGLHVFSSTTTLLDLLYLIPYCSLGFAFALLYTKTNNIFSTIVSHSFHNTLALLLYLTTLVVVK